VALAVAGLAASLLAVVSLWTPWTLVVQETAAMTDSATANGFHTIPQSCLFTCAPGLPSPPSYLVLVLGATTALTFLIWLVNHEQALVRTASGLAAATTVFALANAGYLCVATLTLTSNVQGLHAFPFVGAVLGVGSGVAAATMTVIMLVLNRRTRAVRR
jgi:fermentation-respiration switch protein FrsA (DUF1100 family)